MAIQLPPNIQLEQDPYTRSRAGFNSYLDFVKEQKDRVVSARQLVQHKKLLAEQKQDKMAELQAEYDLKLRNETQIQHMRGVQSMDEHQLTLDAQREANEMNALVKHYEMMRKAHQDGQKDVKDTFTNIYDKYRPALDSLGISSAVRVDYKVDESGMFDTFVVVGDQVWDTQSFSAILEEENNFVGNFKNLEENWRKATDTGETRDTRFVGEVQHIGNDEEGNNILKALRDRNDPMYGTYRQMLLSGRLSVASQDIQGTEAVEKATDEYINYGIAVNKSLTGLSFEREKRLLPIPKNWSTGYEYIDFNQPLTEVSRQINEVLGKTAQWLARGPERDQIDTLKNLNMMLTEYADMFRKSKSPRDLNAIPMDKLFFDPTISQIRYNPDYDPTAKLDTSVLQGGRVTETQLFNRFNVPPAK